MNFIFQFWATFFCFAWMPICISSSKAATSAETNNIDQRMVQESGAVGASASGSSQVNITTLDGGAIAQSFGLAEDVLADAFGFITSSNSASHHTAELALSGALDSVEQTNKAFKDAAGLVEKAYEDAKVGNRSVMTMGALLIAGAVVVFMFKK